MRTIKRLAALAIGALFAHAHAAPPPLTGHFGGSGRACYGTLTLEKKTIAWHTAFSRCKAGPFQLVDESQLGGKRRLTAALTAPASACRFRVISLTHDEQAGVNTGWEATGYADLASYQADKRAGYKNNAPGMMSCALVRDPEEDRKQARK